MSIMIVDYGMGNLTSVHRAFEEAGAAVFISDQPSDIAEAGSLVLPGVGSFSQGMESLKQSGFAEAIIKATTEDKLPLLGICLGMQLLAERGDEGGEHEGLGLIPGSINKMEPSFGERLPHIGWNEVNLNTNNHPMFAGIPDSTDFYFVHSYHFVCPEEFAIAKTPYAGTITSAVARDHIWGMQCHPEKSSKPGLKLLENFVNIYA